MSQYTTPQVTPVGLKKDGNNTLILQWADGTDHILDYRGLRLACPCASCIDEHTGEKILQASMVPADISILKIESVGSYALRFYYSDGHFTGIYTFETLRALGEARMKMLAAKSN